MQETRNPSFAQAARILVVDDEPDLRTLYELTLLRVGYRVESAGDLAQARQQLKDSQFDVLITDMRLPDGLGLELLRELVAQQRPERCLVITAHGSAENAVEALKAGAFDYLTKPVDLKQFRSVVASAVQEPKPPGLESKALEKPLRKDGVSSSNLAAASVLAQGEAALAKLVGRSAAMQAVRSRIVKVAGNMAPVLIQGESGTGKELVARAVHSCSHRAAGPFVAVNCGAIPENLLEAEFFGARKGAYTGSAQDRQGYFQAAQGGTLFLDEMGDLPLPMQTKLLRAIQERVVRPLGALQEDAVDVRIVSATHKQLEQEVQAGRFRQDLFYRLNVIVIGLPPLRDRTEDLADLCNALMVRICSESGFELLQVEPAFLEQLSRHPFAGNVRELENILHRAVALSEAGELSFDMPHMPNCAPAAAPMLAPTPAAASDDAAPRQALVAPNSPPIPDNLQLYLDDLERNILAKVLSEYRFNRTAAAAKLGLTLRQIRYRIARLNIAMPDSPAFESSAPGRAEVDEADERC
jgi:two-component system, NtrC family, response regulator PilR